MSDDSAIPVPTSHHWQPRHPGGMSASFDVCCLIWSCHQLSSSPPVMHYSLFSIVTEIERCLSRIRPCCGVFVVAVGVNCLCWCSTNSSYFYYWYCHLEDSLGENWTASSSWLAWQTWSFRVECCCQCGSYYYLNSNWSYWCQMSLSCLAPNGGRPLCLGFARAGPPSWRSTYASSYWITDPCTNAAVCYCQCCFEWNYSVSIIVSVSRGSSQ